MADKDEETAAILTNDEANEISCDTTTYEQILACVMYIVSNDSDMNFRFEDFGESAYDDN